MIQIPIHDFIIQKVIRTGGDEGNPNAVTEANLHISIGSVKLIVETHYFGYHKPLLELKDLDKFIGMRAQGKLEILLHDQIKKSNKKQKTITQIGDYMRYNLIGQVKKIDFGVKKYNGPNPRIFHYGDLLIDFGINLVFNTNKETAEKFKVGDYVSLENVLLRARFFESSH